MNKQHPIWYYSIRMFGIASVGGSSNAPTSNDDHTWTKIVQVLQNEDINTIESGCGGRGGELGQVSRTIGLIMHGQLL